MSLVNHDKLFQDKNTKVAIVIEDLIVAKEMAQILKKNHGLTSFYHNSLSMFWRETLTNGLPSFAIIDVKRMSEGDLVLKNHPRVKDQTLQLAFYHTEATKILANSIASFTNLGVVSETMDLTNQLKNIVTRLESETELKDQNVVNEEAILRLKNRTARLVSDISEFKNREERTKEAMELVEQLENRMQKAPFMDALLNTMNQWERTINFGLYELNGTAQKLVAPVKKMAKYNELPSLWLGSLAKEGITENARNMSMQVAIDQLGLDVMTVKIQGAKKCPDMLMYVNVEKGVRDEFNWEVFSKLLSGVYARSLAQVQVKENQVKTESNLSSWELMHIIDEHHYNLKAAEIRLVNLSFKNLVDGIKSKSKMRFFWKTFYSDFVIELEKACGNDFKLSEFGVYHMNFLVKSDDLTKFMHRLEDFVVRFSYWRYFEDSSASLALNLYPEIKEIPLTSYSLMGHIDREFDDIDRAVAIAAKEAKRAFDTIQIAPRNKTFTVPRRELRDV